MVITTSEYFQTKIPYIKEFILIFLLFLSYFFAYFSGISLFFNKNIFNLILFLASLIIFVSLQTIVILVFPFFYNLGLIIFQTLVLLGVLGFYLKILNISFIISIIFLILYFIYWWRISDIYSNTLNFKFLTFFKISWDFLTYFLIIFLFILFVLFFNFSQLSKETIQNFIERLNYFFEVANLGINPETKVKDVLSRNLPKDLDEKTKTEVLRMGIEEINKRLNLRLTLDTKVKEAVAEYLYLNFQKFNENQSSSLVYKIILGLFLVMILRYLFLVIGILGSFIGYFIFSLFKAIKLIALDHKLLEKEFIKI